MTQTGAALIAAAYPARYYAQYTGDTSGITTITALVDVQDDATVINKLPSASNMIALTEKQWDLAQTAKVIPVSNGALLYPDRYYVLYDVKAQQPTIVLGWRDTWGDGGFTGLPAASDMLPVEKVDWLNPLFRTPTGKGVEGQKVIDYVPPVPLSTQAEIALAGVSSKTWATFGSLGLSVSQAWVDYQKALKAIVDGTDTTSQTLPTAPS